jgi:hypothetical protein
MATAQHSSDAIEALKRNMADRNWRLCNLYWITDRDGNKVRFTPNWAQLRLMQEWSHRNIILKSRQIGFTTFIQIVFLDLVLFNSNLRCGTIAQDRETAKAIFQDKIKQPYDWLPDGLKAHRPLIRDSANELALNNNSVIRVGTSLRGGTNQYLHISEFGKVCAKFPDKAKEIVTGSLNTVKAGQFVFVESTAEGQDGYFYRMTERARMQQRIGAELTPIDYKFHFYGWHEDPACWIDPTGVVIDDEAQKHFDLLEREHGIVLNDGQKAWWSITHETQQEDMGREYPAHPDEAFAAAVDGSYYGRLIAKAEKLGKVGEYDYVPGYPVQTFHDIGIDDYHSIVFAQFLPGEIRHLHYYQNSGEGAPFYAAYCAEQYEKNGWLKIGDQGEGYDWFPHDGRVREWGTGLSRLEQLIALGFKPRIPTRLDLADGINAVRACIAISTFDKKGFGEGLKMLKNYKKKWNDQTASWMTQPLHNEASHGADAERTLATAYRQVTVQEKDPEQERREMEQKAREARLRAATAGKDRRRGSR